MTTIWRRAFEGLTKTPVYDAFWRFAAERQKVFFRRLRGEPGPWTKDPVLRSFRFTNAYRASDRVSQYLIRHVIYGDKWTDEDLFLRILLFKFFNRIETWELLKKANIRVTATHINFKSIGEVLDAEMRSGQTIYSSAYIMPPSPSPRPVKYKHSSHLALIERMHRDQVVSRIKSYTSMQAAYVVLQKYPLMGPFIAYQLLTDLNYSELTNFTEMEFTVPGPGARSGIRKCFPDLGDVTESDIIRYVTDRQEWEFKTRGVEFISLGGRPLQLIDVQNLFCEIDKYARVTYADIEGLGKRVRIKRRFTPKADAVTSWYPPKWGINNRIAEQLRSAVNFR